MADYIMIDLISKVQPSTATVIDYLIGTIVGIMLSSAHKQRVGVIKVPKADAKAGENGCV